MKSTAESRALIKAFVLGTKLLKKGCCESKLTLQVLVGLPENAFETNGIKGPKKATVSVLENELLHFVTKRTF